jgi:hypothetical protein
MRVFEWPAGYETKSEVRPVEVKSKLEQQPQEITLENEIGDNSDLLEWAKSRNPKMFKTKGREVASTLCHSANKEHHALCKEPWCDCPCHDEQDMKQKVNRRPWGICLGLLMFVLQTISTY